MVKRLLKLDDFIAEYRFWGEWEVSYTDGTHLKECEYVKLGDITIDASEEIVQKYPVLPFTFCPVTVGQIECRFSELSYKRNQVDRAKGFILEQIADSMLRTGLLRPQFCLMKEQIIELRFLEVMRQLSEHGHLTFVVDTSALRRAVISFLHKALPKIPIWTVVPFPVMTEIQEKVYDLNKIWVDSNRGANPNPGKCGVLEKRPQVACISRELNHIRQWRPVEILTTFPEHLGRDNKNSKIDRLIIESMKEFKQTRGLHQGVYLLTRDKDMASLATLENQASLYFDVPSLPSKMNSVKMNSIRYDSHNNRLVLTPIHYFLWDLAQVFSTICLKNKKLCRSYKLVYYSQAQGGFFAHEVMEILEE